MVGLIHLAFFRTLDKHFGAPAVHKVRALARVPDDRDFRMSAAYADDEWHRLLASAIEVTGLSRKDLFTAFSVVFIADAVERWPAWFKMAKNSREFLKLQPLIHNSIASGIVDSEARKNVEKKFRLEERPQSLVLTYRSPNRLCDLYVALAHEVARFYGEVISINVEACTASGDEACVKEIFFSP